MFVICISSFSSPTWLSANFSYWLRMNEFFERFSSTWANLQFIWIYWLFKFAQKQWCFNNCHLLLAISNMFILFFYNNALFYHLKGRCKMKLYFRRKISYDFSCRLCWSFYCLYKLFYSIFSIHTGNCVYFTLIDSINLFINILSLHDFIILCIILVWMA